MQEDKNTTGPRAMKVLNQIVDDLILKGTPDTEKTCRQLLGHGKGLLTLPTSPSIPIPNCDKKRNALYTLYPYGSRAGNYFAASSTVVKASSAQGYNDAVQVAHAGNKRKARPMRKAHFTCYSSSWAGGETQYFIEDGNKPKLTGSPI